MPRKIILEEWYKFWRYTVLKELEPKEKYIRYYLCKCDCWVEKPVRFNHIRSWRINSCWCMKWITHGKRDTRIYDIWAGMKQRIKTWYRYKDLWYDKKWEKFECFYEDMKEWYSDNLSLDRIDNLKWYSKKNCRWATTKEQARNKTNNVVYKWKCLAQWCEDLWINYSTTRGRIKEHNWTFEKALWLT